MNEYNINNNHLIKYCLPLTAVSFIIFVIGLFFTNFAKASLWIIAIFTFLLSLIIYCYSAEKNTVIYINEIENLKKENDLLINFHYALSLVNPDIELEKKVSYTLKTLSEYIPDALFVCYSFLNETINFVAASKTNSVKYTENISIDNPIIEEITEKIKILTDPKYIQSIGGLDKPILISNGRNIQGQIISFDLYSEVYGILVILSKNDLSAYESKLLKICTHNLAIIFNNYNNETDYKTNNISIINEKISENVAEKNIELNKHTDLIQITDILYNSMFPNIFTNISKWHIAKYFVPSENRTDFMDLFNISTDKQLILLGKCSGRGLNAAIYVNKLKVILRCFIDEFQNPANLLNKISKYLNSELMPDFFVDVTAILINSNDRKVAIAMAGNTIPIINRTRSGFAEIPELETGIPLGLFNQGTEPYKNQYINLMPGDGLLLHTDGITDFPGNGQRINNEDLKNFLDKIPEQNADVMLSNLIKIIKEQNTGELPDEDHSLIYLKAE